MSIYGGQAESNARTRFGIAMASMKDRVLDGYKILRDTPHGRTKTQRYRLVRLGGLRGVFRTQNRKLMCTLTSKLINHLAWFA